MLSLGSSWRARKVKIRFNPHRQGLFGMVTAYISDSNLKNRGAVALSNEILEIGDLRLQSPKTLRIAAQYRFSGFLAIPVKVAHDDINHTRVRSRDQADRPIRANHKPVRSKAFEGNIYIRNNLLGFPVLPVTLCNQS